MTSGKDSVIPSTQLESDGSNNSHADKSVNSESLDFKPAGVAELDLYQRREKIYNRRIEGFFQRIRVYTGWPLLLGYFLLPWVNWDNRQAILFDIPARQFYIFDFIFWPQDFPMLAWLMAIAAFTLFAVTVWAGRIWCGYTCPQTVWTAMFMWAEQQCEGSRNQRIKRDKSPMTMDTFVRKLCKHGMWLVIALLTGFTLIGYFSPIRDMVINAVDISMWQWGLGWWEIAWINFFTCATYINAGWMREQVCMYMCPYARFQSVMFDSDTLIVSYDEARGESRGARKKNSDYQARGLGDCIDCKICVQVCPVGIDIRDGLQYECINCALCIDGCNSVMEQMGYDKGLVKYTTENKLAGKPGKVLRPRLVGYAIAIVIMLSLFFWVLLTRTPLKLDVIRDRGALYHETYDGLIENTYTLKIINMSQQSADYIVEVEGLDGVSFVGKSTFYVEAGEVLQQPVKLAIDPVKLSQVTQKIEFIVTSKDESSQRASEKSSFIGPRVN
ncbi:cytochrome c oxidase accessory protein CcoG [bacterium]|nr:cytochrome c oxidase accessory protein CcoG [bacterium]